MNTVPSQDSLGWLLADAFMMDTRSFGGYVKLVGYISRLGSAPSDDYDLATILGITVGYLRKRTWPLIQRFFVADGDGRITHTRAQPMAPARQGVLPTLSEKRRAAGRAGGLQRVANQANRQANGQANGQANPSKNVANSTPVASDFASNLPEFATSPARAPSPSLSSLPFSQPTDLPIEGKEGSEGGGARASADAEANPQANGQANGQANPQANGQANGQAKPPPHTDAGAVRTRMAPDWKPSAQAAKFASGLGYDPAEIAAAMRDHYLGNGETRLDWDARFQSWCREEARRDGQRRQGNAAMAMQGGRAERELSGGNGFDKLVLRDGWNGGYRGGRTIDGQAGPPSNPVIDYLGSEAKKDAG